MAVNIISSNTSSVVTVPSGDLTVISEGVIVGNGVVVTANGDLVVAGQIISESSGVGGSFTSTSEIEVTVLDTGVVFGAGRGLLINSPSMTNPFDLTNHGTIHGATYGNLIYAQDISVVNTGAITGSPAGLASAYALWMESLSNVGSIELINSGDIIGTYGGVRVRDTDTAEIFNSGLISGNDHGIEVRSDAFLLENTGEVDGGVTWSASESEGLIVNSGLIGEGTFGGSIYANAQVLTIQNSGTIVGDIKSLWNSGGASLSLVNTGLIDGDVTAGTVQDATVLNSGTITGDLSFGSGSSNTYLASGDGVVLGQVYGGFFSDVMRGASQGDDFSGEGGNDRLFGYGGDDTFSGGTGSDTVYGGDGNDFVYGDDDSDVLIGNRGDDFIQGDAGLDRLIGNDGADTLNGGTGNDTLFGGNDDDVLNGGADDDRMFGGSGVNTFNGGAGRDIYYTQAGEDELVFNATSESAVGSGRDVVYGFDVGQDVINLEAVAPGVMSFMGTSAFAGGGARSVRIVEYASGSTVVQVDADGDGATDMELMLFRVQGVTEDEFLL